MRRVKRWKESPRPRRHTYDLPTATTRVVVEWQQFSSFADACKRFKTESCLYTFARKSDRTALYVGKATGLRRRYGAALGALKALMQLAEVLLFVAPLDAKLLDFTEHTIVFWDDTTHNTRGRETLPLPYVPILHRFYPAGSGSGLVESGGAYQGPAFCAPGEMRDRHTGARR